MRSLSITGLAAAAAVLALPAWAQPSPQAGQAAPPAQAPGASQPYHRADTPGRPAIPNSDEQYSQSMQRLFQAAQRLREAVQAMARQPAGQGRDEAMRTADRALLETQEAMVQLPPELQGRPEYRQAKSHLDETRRMLVQPNGDPRQTQAAAERFGAGLPALQQGASAQAQGGQAGGQAVTAVQQELRQRLGQAGFRDVQVVDSSYLVRAVAPDGRPVLMVVDPNAAMTGAGQSQASRNAAGPNGMTGSEAKPVPNAGSGTGATGSPSGNSGSGATH